MKFLTGFSRFLSVIFSPMLTATYGVVLSMILSYLCFSPLKARVIVSLVTFAATCALPIIGIFILNRAGVVKEPGLNNREERTLPYLITTACYVGTAIYTRFVNAPTWLTMFILGGAISLVVLTIINRWWKISGHATGMGGITAVIFYLMFSGNSVVDLQPEFITAILLSGMVCTARLILKRHTLGQVAAGFLNGFICIFAAAWWLSPLFSAN